MGNDSGPSSWLETERLSARSGRRASWFLSCLNEALSRLGPSRWGGDSPKPTKKSMWKEWNAEWNTKKWDFQWKWKCNFLGYDVERRKLSYHQFDNDNLNDIEWLSFRLSTCVLSTDPPPPLSPPTCYITEFDVYCCIFQREGSLQLRRSSKIFIKLLGSQILFE